MLDPIYGPYFLGKLVSTFGIWLVNITSAILVYDLTRSATMVGAVSIAQFVPQILLAPWAGALSDRVSRRATLVAGRLLTGGPVGVLGAFIAVRGVDALGGAVPVIVASGLSGIGIALSNPAMLALIPSLVPKADLDVAIALNSTTASVSRAVGPAIGAGLYALGGPATAYGAAGLCQLFFAVIVLVVVRAPVTVRGGKSSAFAGLTYVVKDRQLRALLLAVCGIGLAVDPVMTLTPTLADRLGGGELLVGSLASVFGLGALLAITIFDRWRRHRGIAAVGIGGFGLIATGNLLVAVVPAATTALLGMGLAGIGFLLSTSSLTTRIQRASPPHLLGRVMALWGVAFLGTRPVAAAINGFVADNLSLTAAFVGTAAVAALAGLLLRRLGAEPPAPTDHPTESEEDAA